jgi:putative (di)nucleoside polyphosphate hydrolase
VIDQDGFRSNVGIIVVNAKGKVLWAKRAGSQNAWQFPQGGVRQNEAPIDAMYRELKEELGLEPAHVTVLAESKQWLRYRLPVRFQRQQDPQRCVGQKQKWFLLQLIAEDSSIKLDASEHPEFDGWKWVDYWLPLKQVIFFKSHVYRKVLQEFEKYIDNFAKF